VTEQRFDLVVRNGTIVTPGHQEQADVGITGVNFAVAESGCFVIVTNEGNGRMCSTLPKVHVALMGMERIVPSFRELSVLLPLLDGTAVSVDGSTLSAHIGLSTPRAGRVPVLPAAMAPRMLMV